MDIAMVVHKNYRLLTEQIKHWNEWIKGEKQYFVLDNTPASHAGPIGGLENVWVDRDPAGTYDGISHGKALDFLVRKTTSKIIGIVDTDFFWLKPDILSWVEEKFAEGNVCVGCAGYYPDWVKSLDPRWPERRGNLAPVVWGMFIDRDLALSETFICAPNEGCHVMETGWRIRDKIIKEKLKNITLAGFNHIEDSELCYFGEDEDKPQWGVHLLKGSTSRMGLTDKIPKILREGKSQWL